jgi:hypothetical protein
MDNENGDAYVPSEQVEIVMSAAEWAAFCEALGAPPREIPALKKLLKGASVFDEACGRRDDSPLRA